MKRTLLKHINVIFLLLSVTTCKAASLYGGGTLGAGINDFTSSKNYVDIRHPAHASLSWSAFVGVKLNRRLSIELGYLNLGFYENSGNGQSICDETGKCGYPKTGLLPLRFNTKLTVVNNIEAQFYYLDIVGQLWTRGNFSVYSRLGAAYNQISFTSYVDVFPNIIDHVGPEIQRTSYSKAQTRVTPNIAIGYEYRANKNLFLRSEINYFIPVEMIDEDDGSKQGTFKPCSLSFGVRMLF